MFSVTKTFNSTLDSGEILNGTLYAINNAFPQLEPTLILSNDQDRKTSVPYKLFDYTSERPTTVDAYVSGEITTEFVTRFRGAINKCTDKRETRDLWDITTFCPRRLFIL